MTLLLNQIHRTFLNLIEWIVRKKSISDSFMVLCHCKITFWHIHTFAYKQVHPLMTSTKKYRYFFLPIFLSFFSTLIIITSLFGKWASKCQSNFTLPAILLTFYIHSLNTTQHVQVVLSRLKTAIRQFHLYMSFKHISPRAN